MDLKVSENQIFSAKFSPENSMIAASTENGLIKVQCGMNGEPLYSIKSDAQAAKIGNTAYPVTELAWKPNFSDS
jgi:hypothetical protein